MADFKTHITVAAVLSTPLAACAMLAGYANMNEVLMYALAGTLGGLLPDIDADESIAIRLVFRLFGILVSGLILLFWMNQLPHWQVLALATAAYLAIRFPIQWVFEQFTVHRGTLHSLLANVFFTSATVLISYYLFNLEAKTAWGIGGFVFFGATIHLILDELYSIDLTGMRIKRSFGTALKLTDWGEPLASIVLLLGCIAGYWFSPNTDAWQPAFAWLPEPATLSEWFSKGVASLERLKAMILPS